MASDPVPLWLDVDTGHDDAFALLIAAHDPNAKLLGVTTVHGNASLPNTTYNTRGILEAIGRRDIVVYPGSAKPISREVVHAADIHGESGLDGVTLLPEPVQPVQPAADNVDFLEKMYSALIATPVHTAWLISTGTLTNIGLLFQRYPDLAEHIKGLSIMGGAIGGGFSDAPMGTVKGEGERFGNWTPYAEFNIYCDPEAAASIFTNPTLAPKTVLIPLDLTHQVLATASIRHTLLYGPSPPSSKTYPTALRALFTQILVFFAHTYAEVFALTAGPPLHDPLTVAAALYPDMFDDAGGERFSVEVVTEGVHTDDKAAVGQLGRTKAVLVKAGEGGVRIPRTLKVGDFWSLVESSLERADAVSPMKSWPASIVQSSGVLDTNA
ncbi:Inosine/uridine-preferring nucleoside hydrolase [Lophium mytilinum]|uniref:Inosine/uridine-preferring nucleoside hydrolase n=1 Tax=Lophium mytilinum TaxID=390894 RepID=A0A6A6RDQ2_9PEZI|nr:Inosine/uridine-preferring nucleoside hydrolase [Lophium mytilinum]